MMHAMVYTAPLELKILEVEEPQPGPGEIVVEVSAVGICGSELEGFASQSPFRVPPLIMGHEFSGRRLDTGERVVINPLINCGRCDLCLRGLTNLCRVRAIIGIHRGGGFAQRVAVPETNCYALPEDVSIAGAALVEPLANAIHAFKLTQLYDACPLRVGVIGAGTLGFVTALVAHRRGVPAVEISDLSPARREFAKATGASAIGERLDGEFDVIFDTVGTAATRASSVELLRPGGTALWIGLHGPESGVDGLGLIRNEKRILGTFCYQDVDFRAAIVQAAELDLTGVATYPLENGVDVFERLVAGDVSSLKSMLLPNGPLSETAGSVQ
jgi:threonine dehydrogenase-like Zn-dependent dehydrogenase